MRWGQKVRGRKTSAGCEVLLGPELQTQQLTGPPSNLYREATVELIRIEPLMSGVSVELHTYFDAAYQHGDHLSASMVYITLDARERPICFVTEQPSHLSLIACKPVSDLTTDQEANFYLPAEELARDRRVLDASARLSIRHPTFDIEQARKRAGITEGTFGYDIQTNRWILVDPEQRRTLVVGTTGEPVELPGDWLKALLTLNAVATVQISWRAGSVIEANRTRARLEQAGIENLPFKHKGYISSTTLLVTMTHSNVSVLAQLICETGARLESFQVVS